MKPSDWKMAQCRRAAPPDWDQSPGGIGIAQAAPAAAIERRPLTFRLRQTLGHRVDDSGVMAHAAMAAFDLDGLGPGGRLFHAPPPRGGAVCVAEERRRRYRRRARKPPAEPRILFIGAAAARHLIDAPGIGRFWISRQRHAG